MKNNSFHKNFRLNGNSFSSVNKLLAYVRHYDSSVYSFLFQWFISEGITVQTSGSTGKPKIIQLQKEQMINSALATREYFNLQENTTALLCLSPDFIAGKMMFVRALTLGWQLDVVSPTSKVKIEKEYSFSAMVPMQVQNSLNDLHKIKKLIVGGGVVSEGLKKQLQNIKTQVFATYGMTETITHVAIKKVNHIKQKPNFYEVLPNVKIYIDNRNCLVINALKVSKKVVFTNDVVQLVSENKFEWLGRFDNVINSGGIKLHPEKIEEKLSKIIEQRFFVSGILDEKFGEKLILIVESDVSLSEVKKSLFDKIKNLRSISKYETPKEIYFVEEFVETETKKIQRNKTLNLINL